MKEWTLQEEAANLRRLLSTVKNKAQFAREYGVPGGASMLSQHQSGHRPIGLDAAMAYARGLGVPLSEISPRLANRVAKLPNYNNSTSVLPVPDADLPHSLETVANALQRSDDLTLAQIRPLLERLVDTPARAPEIVPRVAALLRTSNNPTLIA